MNKPKIRFKGFDGEWEKKTIGEVATFSKGNGFSKSDLKQDGGNPIILYGRLYTNYSSIIDDVNTYADMRDGAILSTGNEVVIPASGETAEDIAIASAVKQKGVILGGDLNILKFKENFETAFMAINISNSTTHKELSRLAQGKSVVHLRNNDIAQSNILYPSLPEQQAIAEYFKQLDSLINLTEKKISSLKQVKQASLHSMFPQEGEATPRVRFKGFSGEWEKVKFGTLGTTYSGLSGKTKDDFGQGNAQYITFLNVLTNAQIDVSKLEQVNVNERQNAVTKGDILFNTSSETPEEVGLCSVMLDEIKNVYLNSFCFGFRPTSNALDSKFLVYLMRGDIGRSIMKILAQGATRYNLSKNKLCEANVILPSLPEQQAIANYFTNLDKQIRLQEARLAKLKSVKASCLDLMFV